MSSWTLARHSVEIGLGEMTKPACQMYPAKKKTMGASADHSVMMRKSELEGARFRR